ncbi:MAG: glycosyltransferase family 2 protein [Candidatus Hydrogenedentales bacterium]|jgi:glycosyltransferase involved in cell wall biosynthesis
MKLSFVIPACNERESVRELVEGILHFSAGHDVQILFIDDGSTDGTYDELTALRSTHPEVEICRFRRNLGKSMALAAGFNRVSGDLVFTMDADLQDDPREIPVFLEKLEEGFDVVVGWKKVRHDPWHKVLPSRLYNLIVSRVLGLKLHDINCGYKLFRREVVERLSVYGERHRLLPALARELGYRITEVPVHHNPRRYGRSKYGIERFMRGAIDVGAMLFLYRYANRPVHFFGFFSLLLLGLGGGGLVAGLARLFMAKSRLWTAAFLLGGTTLCAVGLLMLGLGLLWELTLHFFAPAHVESYIVEEPE